MNISELLKYCPKGTKLYSTVFGEVKFFEVYPDNLIGVFIMNDCKRVFRKDGTYYEYGECVLFPSEDQRDWNKFRLPVKKGDIMMSITTKRAFIASGGIINGQLQYICGINMRDDFQIVDDNNTIWTSDFCIPASKEAKEELFDKMAEAGYRWNADTLKLEKIEPEFKEGNVYINKEGDLYLPVGKIAKDIGKAAILYPEGRFIAEAAVALPVEGLVLATPSDINKLFSFLIKRGYKYDKEHHKLIKQEFKPFDKVLVRDEPNQEWSINLFSYYDEEDKNYPYVCLNARYSCCIPYRSNEYFVGKKVNIH